MAQEGRLCVWKIWERQGAIVSALVSKESYTEGDAYPAKP